MADSKKVKFREVVPSFIQCNTGWGPTVCWRDMEDTFKRWATYVDGNKGLNLSPDYQRDHIWTKEQQSSYIEYIMRGGLSGRDVYFNNPSWGRTYDTPVELVDGKQRIHAVLAFLKDEVKVFGKYVCSDFERLDDSRCWFTFHMNTLRTRKEVMQWYVEFNSGGTVHTNEEIERVKELIKKEK